LLVGLRGCAHGHPVRADFSSARGDGVELQHRPESVASERMSPSSPRDVVVAAFHGELDLSTAADVAAELDEVDPHAHVVIDLGRTTFVDSVTLSCFITASRRHGQHGSRLVLADARGAVRRVLAITGLDLVMDYADSVAEACTQLRAPDQSDPIDPAPLSKDET
jgi:anti-anti-sigma factor